MGVLEHPEPGNVFHFSEEIPTIPHGPTNTGAINDWCVSFTKAYGLEYHQDSFSNVIIMKGATPGYEGMEPITLQGCLGMVCEKEPGCTKNMEKKGVNLVIDGDRIRAKGTALDGGNGITVAMALTVLNSKELSHPCVEAILTVDKEIDMLGTTQLDMSPLKDRKFISLNSKEEGIFVVSCAGGNMTRCCSPIARTLYFGTVLNIMMGGLLGGYSGADIGKGRASASTLLGRLLYAAKKKSDSRLISIEGGRKGSATPQQSEALLVAVSVDLVHVIAADIETVFKSEHQKNDPGLFVEIKDVATELVPMDEAATRKVLHVLTCMSSGIQEMSADVGGPVRTSLNLDILITEEKELPASFCLHGSVATRKQMLVNRLVHEMELLGGSIQIFGDYPAWEYKHESALRDLTVRIFQKQYGHDPEVSVIHTGLECGMFMGKLPDLDCVSIGPDILEVHTCRESVSISSVGCVWDYLIEILQCLE